MNVMLKTRLAARSRMMFPDYAAPFDAFDSVLAESEHRIVCERTLDLHDPVFAGHYPNFPIFPGVFIYEAFAQAIRHFSRRKGWPLTRVNRVKSLRFVKSLHPGDTYRVTVEHVGTDDDGIADFRAKCESDDASLAVATLSAGEAFVPCSDQPFATTDSQDGATRSATLLELQAVLPQRYPMLLVDRALAVRSGRFATATKNISISEPCYRFCRHAKNEHSFAYPHSLLIESFAQTAGLLLDSVWNMSSAKQSHAVAFGAFQDIALHGSAFPGDTIVHHVELEHANAASAMFRGASYIDDKQILSCQRLIGLLLPRSRLS